MEQWVRQRWVVEGSHRTALDKCKPKAERPELERRLPPGPHASEVDRNALPPRQQGGVRRIGLCSAPGGKDLRVARRLIESSDPAVALKREATDRVGPGQAFAKAIIEVSSRLVDRGCLINLRWGRPLRQRGSREPMRYGRLTMSPRGSGQLRHLTRNTIEAGPRERRRTGSEAMPRVIAALPDAETSGQTYEKNRKGWRADVTSSSLATLYWLPPGRANAHDPVERVLVVSQRRTPVPASPPLLTQEAGPGEQKMCRSGGEACGWKQSRAPSVQLLFQGDRAARS